MEVAWRFKTDNLGPRPETKLEGTPLMVKGTLYATAGTRRAVVALDARTGEQKWVYSMDEGERATRWAPRQLSGRGLSYWTDGKGDERVIYVTTGYRLVALNAKTGQPIQNFGDKGVVDLKDGVMHGKNGKQVQIDLEKGEIGLHSTPTVVDDIDHRRFVDVRRPRLSVFEQRQGPRARVRRPHRQAGLASSTRCPAPARSITRRGRTVRGSGPATPACGRRSPSILRPASFTCRLRRRPSTSTAAIVPATTSSPKASSRSDLKTGEYKWHFQFVHHPLWDHDMSSAPLLMDVTIDGKPRKVVAVPSKQGWLYCFDRITGQPIWPIEEKPVPQSDMPGEKTAKTQPFPTKPPAYSRTHVAESDLIDFTPALRKQALENLKLFRWEQIPYVPPVGPNSKLLGTINIANTSGGVNWPGSGFDPETGIFYTQAGNSAVTAAKYDEEEFHRVSPENQKAIGSAALGSGAGLRHAVRAAGWRSGRRRGAVPGGPGGGGPVLARR